MNNYSYEDLGYGCTITSPDGKEVFLQGDDHSQLDQEIEEAFENHEPSDAFPEYQDLENAILSNYF